MNMTVEQFLANGGQIAQVEAAPVHKINTGNTQAQIIALLQSGAKTIDHLIQQIGSEKAVLGAYRNIRNKGIPIIIHDGFMALDSQDITRKEVTVLDNKRKPLVLNERQISFALGKYYLNNKHLVVVNNLYWTGHECDIFCVTKSLKPIEFEIKISRQDFLNDAKKEKWKRPISVWKHYYIMPEHIFKEDMLRLLPHPNSGILVLSQNNDAIYITERKKAVANQIKVVDTKTLVNITRLVSLRLWQGGCHA